MICVCFVWFVCLCVFMFNVPGCCACELWCDDVCCCMHMFVLCLCLMCLNVLCVFFVLL